MLVATYMRSLQGRGDLKTLVSSGSRYSSAAAFAFFIQAVSWYVCPGLLPSIGRSGLLFKWQRLARRIRRHLHRSAALLLVANAADLLIHESLRKGASGCAAVGGARVSYCKPLGRESAKTTQPQLTSSSLAALPMLALGGARSREMA